MSKIKEPKQLLEGLAPMEQVRMIVGRVNQARDSSTDIESLRCLLRERPELIGNLASLVKRSIDRHINQRSISRTDREKYRLRVERERRELASENDGPLEKLLVENVIFCLLRLESIGQGYTQVMESVGFDDPSPRVIKYWKKRLASAQNRYSKAWKMLALVRKLLPRARLKSGIGTANAFVNDL